MATYGTPVAPAATLGFLVEPVARVLLGTGGVTDLESTSWPAQVYSAPIGLGSGKGIELGSLVNLAFSHVPTVEPVEAANFENALYYEVNGEETQVTVEIKEWKPQVLAEALATGHLYVLGSEALMTFGGGCNVKEMPLVIEWTNNSCKVPGSANIGTGVTGMIMTLYKTQLTSGLDISSLVAREQSTISLTFQAIHDTARAVGNRLGSIYLY